MNRSFAHLLVVSGLFASCYSTATLHTARPIEKGEVQGAFALGSFVGEEDGDFAALPTLEGQVRFGLDERFDLGVQITNLGILGIDVNYAVLLTEDQALSIDPTVEFTYGTYLWLPILWDFHQTENLTLTGSIRGGRYWPSQDNAGKDYLLDDLEADVWLYGPGLAAKIRLNDSVSLAPEVRVLWADREGVSTSPPLVSVSLGLIF
ncbi:hypothetical protein Poly30_51120 [Planctomycetes bacterium Poly30]|uniref:Outer membrane protein beta-barrel domain-containing protein n=1 Tax=Saltatorellus ferox TaxID=2528018 RepID=A0A518EZP3_9BACT|nr:hypothetical protein Poly30_51120 [Planctomycetes bacterium Poly30]